MEATTTTNTAGKWGYIAHYKNQRAEVYTNQGIAAAKDEAARLMKVTRAQRWKIAIMPAQRPDGTEIIHTPDF